MSCPCLERVRLDNFFHCFPHAARVVSYCSSGVHKHSAAFFLFFQALASVKLFLHKRGICVDLEGLSGIPAADLGAAARARPSCLSAVLGMETGHARCGDSATFPLVVDGAVVCRLDRRDYAYWVELLRDLKSKELENFKKHWEVVGFPHNRYDNTRKMLKKGAEDLRTRSTGST